jgi:hypothetical protein
MALCCTLFGLAPWLAQGQEVRIDVVVYGATPAGIAAAVSAAKDGQTVLLVEPTDRIGGMLTSGLSWTDARTLESITGLYQQFCMRLERYYISKYGIGSPQHEGSFRGLHGEPSMNLVMFSQMLNEVPPVRLLRKYKLGEVDIGGKGELKFIRTAQFVSASGAAMVVRGRVFIDATYEGDLMAKARVDYTVGREGPEAYGESLAKDVPKGGDKQVQGYNFRLSMTNKEENRVMPKAPNGYKREDFVGVLPLLESGKIKQVFSGEHDGIYRTHLPLMPNQKADVNDTPHAPVRLSMPDINDAYPDGDEATRQRIYDQHVYYNLGLLYFLQNDKQVPEDIREAAREWGFCKDEFVDNGYFPPQLYIREARRMIGQYVYTENDASQATNDVRSKLFTDAIAMGDYSLNCHGTGREGTRYEGKHVGEFYKNIPPFQVPYGVIVPKNMGNLLVPVAVSASHVGFSCLRMEPTWMSLGQAAGHAAALSIFEGKPVQAITVPLLQDKLHQDKLATIYLSDVGPGSSLFKAAQWFGTRGAFHGLVDPSILNVVKQERIFGQYSMAAPGHEVNPRAKIDEATLAKWVAIAQAEGIDVKKAGRLKGLMRGEVLERLYWVKYPEPKKKK